MSLSPALNIAQDRNGPLLPFADTLRARGISTAEPSLIQAMRNEDPEIRIVAALELAEDRHEDAVPLIEEAFSHESVPKVQIGIATALLSLGDPRGLQHLHGMCADGSLSIDDVGDVVRNLAIMKDSTASCLDPALGFLGSHCDSESRLRAMWMLPDLYASAPPAERSRISGMLEDMLNDPDPAVRLTASNSLAQANIATSMPSLRMAIANEADATVRAGLERDLRRLEGR
jgi:HEAT repeat protein